jgi:hypothetical protein
MVPSANAQSYTPATSGIYSATQTDAVTGCESVPSNCIYFMMTGDGERELSGVVSVYPNPFHDVLHVKFELPAASMIKITLMDSFGKELKSVNLHEFQGTHTLTMNSSDLKPGLFYCKIQTDSYSLVKKLILSR